LLRPVEQPTRKVPIDRVGLGLLVIWVGCLQIMLDIGRDHDWFSDDRIVALAITSFIAFLVFIIWELTEEHPIVDLRIFRHSGFTFGVLAFALCFGSYFAGIVVIPQWLQSSLGYTAAKAGFVTACTAIAAITTSQLAARMMAFTDPRLMVSGAIAWLGCMALVRSHWTSDADFWTLASPQLIQGFGMSFFMLPLTLISLGSVLPEETASAAGMQNFMRTLAIGIATAVALTIWGNTQQEAHNELASRLQPDDAMRVLSDAGFSAEQGRMVIANMVDRESITVAVDYVFLVTAVVFFLCSAVIWLAPRPAPLPGRAPAK
jgi:DHA2 family multidrug resistance protein